MPDSAPLSAQLTALALASSKHSDYQTLHPMIASLIGGCYAPAGKKEAERFDWMSSRLPLSGKSVLDIGANTGYFSFAAISAGASQVRAVEGNAAHAAFMQTASAALTPRPALTVANRYFDFGAGDAPFHDVVFCLNVLHHLGDDFGNPDLNVSQAKAEIARSLQALARQCDVVWLQLGFNWKGRVSEPLFARGSKQEVIDFVTEACDDAFAIESTAIYDPASGTYAAASEALKARFDSIGEFLNRPLFLLRARRDASAGTPQQ